MNTLSFVSGYKFGLGVLAAIATVYLILIVTALVTGVIIAATTNYATFLLYWHMVGPLLGVPL